MTHDDGGVAATHIESSTQCARINEQHACLRIAARVSVGRAMIHHRDLPAEGASRVHHRLRIRTRAAHEQVRRRSEILHKRARAPAVDLRIHLAGGRAVERPLCSRAQRAAQRDGGVRSKFKLRPFVNHHERGRSALVRGVRRGGKRQRRGAPGRGGFEQDAHRALAAGPHAKEQLIRAA